jgi:hypothetical protein
MDHQLTILFILTFVINLVGSLAYSVRIAGIRTRRIALSFSLFNILVLVSRTANSFQSPLLAKRVERNVITGMTAHGIADFRWLLLAASLATVFGGLFTPSFQRLFTRAVESFARSRSMGKMALRALSPSGLAYVLQNLTIPAATNLNSRTRQGRIPYSVLAVNTGATAIWTVGVFASLYAAYLNPNLRATTSNLSSVVNGLATILLFTIVDPWLSVVTDDVMQGRTSEAYFRHSVIGLLGSRLAGTILAQLLLIPAAGLVAAVAARI